jgi:septum site-determining protein MinD
MQYGQPRKAVERRSGHPDEIILVATPDDLCIRDAERALQVLTGKKLPRPRVIVNRRVPDYIEIGEMYKASTVAEPLDVQLLGEVPEEPAVYRAQLNHLPILDVDCEARSAALRIAGRMMGENPPFPDYGKKRPWYSRFFHPVIGEVKRIDR